MLLIQLSRDHTAHDHAALQARLDDFTASSGLPASKVAAHGPTLIMDIPAQITGEMRGRYFAWFNAECERIDSEIV
jgi:hypothetical protein